MNRADFYKSLRRRNSGVFGTSLSKRQVEGTEALLDECQKLGADLGQTAYILATAYGETGGKMRAVREGMYYKTAARIRKVFSASRRQGIPAEQLTRNPQKLANTVYGGEWGKKHLGNIMPNDGWDFRGALPGQITGRRNFKRWSENLGVNFIGNPALLDKDDPKLNARALVEPMLDGWATGKKLSDFIDGPRRDYRGARQVWNGNFEAAKYAGYARAFETALEAGGWKLKEFVRPDVEPRQIFKAPAPEIKKPEPKKKRGFIAWMLGR